MSAMNPQHENAQTVISVIMIQILCSAMGTVFERDDDVVIFGQDASYFNDVFHCTEGLREKYGAPRVFDASISESDIIDTAVGMDAYGLCLVVKVQSVGYVCPASGQLIPKTTRLRYYPVGGFVVPMAVRIPCGGDIYDEQIHSQGPEAMFTQVCSLRMAIPPNPYDARGLLTAYVENDNLVIPLEPKCLCNGPFDGHHDCPVTPWSKYPASRVPDGYYKVLLDEAATVCPDAVLAVLTYGTMVYVAQAAADETGLDAKIIDLRSLWSLDLEIIAVSVKKIGRYVIAHEATRICGLGAELMSLVQEHCFHHLEVPTERVIGWNTPYPHTQEWAYFLGPARAGAVFKHMMEV